MAFVIEQTTFYPNATNNIRSGSFPVADFNVSASDGSAISASNEITDFDDGNITSRGEILVTSAGKYKTYFNLTSSVAVTHLLLDNHNASGSGVFLKSSANANDPSGSFVNFKRAYAGELGSALTPLSMSYVDDNFIDESDNDHNGTVNSTTYFAYEKTQQRAAGFFNGTSDNVTLTNVGNDMTRFGSTIIVDFEMRDVEGSQFLFGVATPRVYLQLSGNTYRTTLGDNDPQNSTKTIAAGDRHQAALTWAFTTDDSGSYVQYIDGVDVTGGTGVYKGLSSIPASPTVPSIGASSWAYAKIYGTYVYNRALTAAEILDVSTNKRVSSSDMWGSQSNLVTGHTNNGGSSAYETFTTSGATITSASNAASGNGISYSNTFSGVQGEHYRLQFTRTLASGSAPHIQVTKNTTGVPTTQAVGSSVPVQEVTANFNNIEFTISETDTYRVNFRVPTDKATEFITDTVSLTKTGAVGHYKFEPNQVDIDNDGFLIAETYNTTESFSNYNVEFDTGNNTANIKFGLITLSDNLKPNITPSIDLPITYNFDGITINESFSGKKYTTKRFGQRRLWDISWETITAADKVKFETFITNVGGTQYPFHFTLNYNLDNPIIYFVRLAAEPVITQTSPNLFAISLSLIEEF